MPHSDFSLPIVQVVNGVTWQRSRTFPEGFTSDGGLRICISKTGDRADLFRNNAPVASFRTWKEAMEGVAPYHRACGGSGVLAYQYEVNMLNIVTGNHHVHVFEAESQDDARNLGQLWCAERVVEDEHGWRVIAIKRL